MAESGQRRVLSYVCGPGGFTRDMGAALLRCGVEHGDVRFEVWW